MPTDAWITLAVVVAMLVVLVREVASPPAVLMGGVIGLVLVDVIDPAEAFAGFANPATITIAALFVVARAVRQTGGLGRLVTAVLGAGVGDRRVLTRLVAPVTAASGFLNNTPIVATLAPVVRRWAEERQRPPSRYLMPLSFAAILGGMVTTIGTSTNLVVSGLLSARGEAAFGLFEVTAVGLPAAVLGGIAIVLLAPRVLPSRVSPGEQLAEHGREYTFRMRVEAFGALDGKQVGDAGLRNLAGVYLAGVDRSGTEISPVGPEETLLGGDVLTFVGRVDHVRDLQAMAGLENTEEEHVAVLTGDGHRFYEVVLGQGSSLVGRTLKDVGFRGRYDAAVVAIHRAGQRVDAKLGQVRLEVGDVLLLLADAGFGARWADQRDFLLVTELGERTAPTRGRSLLVGTTVVGMVVAAGVGLLPILEAALAAVAVLVITRTMKVSEARDAVDLDVILLVAGALGIGAAVETSGLAARIAEGLVSVGSAVGSVGALAAILLATMLLTEMISNTAAAALLLPVALDTAVATGADPRGFAVAVAVMASASFLTPVGYQTNTMVYGLGGYRYTDYARLGAPLSVLVLATCLVVVPLVWG